MFAIHYYGVKMLAKLIHYVIDFVDNKTLLDGLVRQIIVFVVSDNYHNKCFLS